MKRSLMLFVFLSVFLGVFVSGTAIADIISFSGGPWAAVEVNQSDDEAVITVRSYDNFLINGFGINPNGYRGYSDLTPGFTLDAIPGCPDPLQPKNMAGFGMYSLVFMEIPPNAVDTLSVTLYGTGWMSAADVLALNDEGYLAAAHITGNTGFASAAPIPAAAWLLGFGVVGLVGAKKRIS